MPKRLIKSSHMGFCPGVRRAVDLFKQHGSLESLGPVVHNRQVVDMLSTFGVATVKSLDEAKGKAIGIPSHGVPKPVLDEARRRGLTIVNATCPTVQRAQETVKQLADEGFFTVIFGDPDHTEVKGLLGWADGNGLAITDQRDFFRGPHIPRHKGPLPSRVGFLSQTTQTIDLYVDFLQNILCRSWLLDIKEIRVINTICPVTKERLRSAIGLAHQVDLMVVVGDRLSGNTRRLFQACAGCTKAVQVESAEEINGLPLDQVEVVGLTAGASTPDWVIEEVEKALEVKIGTA